MITIMPGYTKPRLAPPQAAGMAGLDTDSNVNRIDWIRQSIASTALIATPGQDAGVGDWLWPLLAARSGEQRWQFWIAPPEWPTANLLKAHGVDPSRVRLVHLSSDSDPLPVVERALRAGTCGAVLAWPKGVDATQWSRIRQAASENQALAVLMPSQADLSVAA
jgi:cell division inhibitor SulA